MEIVNWEFESLRIKMIDIDGELYCTSRAVCEALGIKDSTLREFYRCKKIEFDSLSVRNCDAKAMQSIKTELGIKRLRKDMKLWSEDDILTFAFMVKGERAREVRKDFRKFIKHHAKKSMVSQEQYRRELDNLRQEMEENAYLTQKQFQEDKAAMRQDMEEIKNSIKSFSHGARSTIGRMNNLGERAKGLYGKKITTAY